MKRTNTQTKTKAYKSLSTEERFFFDHAGYAVGQGETRLQGRIRGARKLVRATKYARDNDWCFTWANETDVDDSFVAVDNGWTQAEVNDWNNTSHECLVCILTATEPLAYWGDGFPKDASILASLSGIFDPDTNYRRVVEAELASEALADIEREKKNAAECARLLAC